MKFKTLKRANPLNREEELYYPSLWGADWRR